MLKNAKNRVERPFFWLKRLFEPVPVRILSIRFYKKSFALEFYTCPLLWLASIFRLLHAVKCNRAPVRRRRSGRFHGDISAKRDFDLKGSNFVTDNRRKNLKTYSETTLQGL